jgi:chemotaxis protein CheX
MEAHQLKLFQDITLQYFAKLAPGEPPALEEPFLRFGEPAGEAGGEKGGEDFTSLVAIQGEYDGCLYLSAPRSMLRELLAVNGEPEVSEATLRDMCRELSNVLSGNASQAFGGNWEISVPQTLDQDELRRYPLPPSAFVMPFRWRGARSLLVVALAPPDSSSTSIPVRGFQNA